MCVCFFLLGCGVQGTGGMLESSSGLWTLLGRLARRQLCSKQSKAYFHSTRCLPPAAAQAPAQSLGKDSGAGAVSQTGLGWPQTCRITSQSGCARGFAALGCVEEVSGSRRQPGSVTEGFRGAFGRQSNAGRVEEKGCG